VTGPLHPSALPGSARRSRLVTYLAVGYTLLIVYASLYPLHGWSDPPESVFSFIFAPWPRYYTITDLALNVIGYVPLGFLVALMALGFVSSRAAAFAATLYGLVLSLVMESLQAFLPARVPSNLDLLNNCLGALAGATVAVTAGGHWLLSGHLYRLRERVFLPGAVVDFGFVVLLLWLLTQLNAELWLFGNGDLRWVFDEPRNLNYSPESYRWIETSVTALNLAAICLLTSALARRGQSVAGPLVVLVSAALLLKSVAALALFKPGDAAFWLTPGSMLGIPLGLLLYLFLTRFPATLLALAVAVLLLAGMLVLNVAPTNPYLQASVQTWRYGHFLSFNGVTRLVSTLWPFVAVGYVIWLTLNPPRTDRG
jgi:VanZ family protein